MNPVEEFLKVSSTSTDKTAAPFGALWRGMKFQELDPAIKATSLEQFSHVLGSQLTAGTALGALGGGGESVLRGMKQLVNMGMDKWKKPMEYKAMLAAHPELKDEDAAKVQSLYNSLRHMSPHMAKDPVIAGSFVRTLLNQGGDGSSVVPMDTAKMLADTQKNVRDARRPSESAFPKMLTTGMPSPYAVGRDNKTDQSKALNEDSRSEQV